MIKILPNSKNLIVKQKNKIHGCVSTAFEWMIRWAGLLDEDALANFQEEFNLFKKVNGGNTIKNVMNAIQKKYKKIPIKFKEFSEQEGDKKVKFIEELIEQENPCLVSMSNGKEGWHIQVVYGFDTNEKIFLLHNPETKKYYNEIIEDNKAKSGGHDIAWLSLNNKNSENCLKI